jgi:hypothetical protein
LWTNAHEFLRYLSQSLNPSLSQIPIQSSIQNQNQNQMKNLIQSQKAEEQPAGLKRMSPKMKCRCGIETNSY